LHRYLAKKIADHKFNDDGKRELQRLHSELTFDTAPPFSLYLRCRYCIDTPGTTWVILRTDAVAANFY
jgi:hypothetical protein